jgi:hypothetical protein
VVLWDAEGVVFEDHGIHTLKGFSGEWRLFAYIPDAPPPK